MPDAGNDRNGRQLWSLVLPEEVNALSVATDTNDNVLITGGNSNSNNAYITSMNSADGSLRWTVPIGTGSGEETGTSVTADTDGNVFATGTTTGAVDGTNAGGNDGFLVKLNAETGEEEWRVQFGSAQDDKAYAVVATDRWVTWHWHAAALLCWVVT